MLLQKVERGAGGWGEGCGLARPQEGLQQRSEWPRILHSAVQAHRPREGRRNLLLLQEQPHSQPAAINHERTVCGRTAALGSDALWHARGSRVTSFSSEEQMKGKVLEERG